MMKKWIFCALGAVIICFTILHLFRARPGEPSTEVAARPTPPSIIYSEPTPKVLKREPEAVRPRQTSAPQSMPTQRAPRTARQGSAVVAQQLLASLPKIDPGQGTMTSEQALQWNQALKQLVEQGQAAVPAIREFLSQGQDMRFDTISGGEFVDYSSLRVGLLDVLVQAGGNEAKETLMETLQTTKDPLEIALLARALDAQAPDQYREQAVAAARELLALASSGQWNGRDVSPLFELMQRFGDTNVVSDLERVVGQWKYYATIALAGLQNGAGIPTLIRLAQDPEVSARDNGDYALRPLAQAAMQYPEAGTALVDAARSNRIRDTAWPAVADALAGNYIQYGNQIFGSSSPALNWSEAQINRRLDLINQMLGVTSNPTGVQALQNARSSLLARLGK